MTLQGFEKAAKTLVTLLTIAIAVIQLIQRILENGGE